MEGFILSGSSISVAGLDLMKKVKGLVMYLCFRAVPSWFLHHFHVGIAMPQSVMILVLASMVSGHACSRAPLRAGALETVQEFGDHITTGIAASARCAPCC